MTNSASSKSGLFDFSAKSTKASFVFALSIILSQTASQLPAHSLTLPAIAFNISESPLMSSSLVKSSSFFESYFIKSTNPFSVNGSCSQCFLTSVIWVILLHLWSPSALLTGLATTTTSVALKLVLGTPKSFTTLSKTPYGESPWIVPATTFANAPILIASYNARASLLLISPIISAESPILNVVLMPSSAGTSLVPFVSAAATFIDWILNPSLRIWFVGNSKVSSIVIILYFLIIS